MISQLIINHYVVEKLKPVCIIGAGRFGRALARLAHDCGEYVVHLGSRSLSKDDLKWACPNVVLHSDYAEAIATSKIVILAVPPQLVRSIATVHSAALTGKIVVDVSNPSELKRHRQFDETIMHDLTRDFPQIKFVKCFNTISAENLEGFEYPIGFTGEAFVCGDHMTANEEVLSFVHDLGIPGRILGKAEKTKFLENYTAMFMQQWRLAFWITLGVMLFFYAYTVVWSSLASLLNWARFTLIFQQVFGQTGLNLLALTYLPGTLAQFLVYSHYNSPKPVILPRWLAGWMKIRAKLGNLSVYFILMHTIMECYTALYVGPATVPPLKPYTLIVRDISIFFATVGISFGVIVALITIPSIAEYLSYREWKFFQRYIGWGYFLFGVTHVTLYWSQFWVAGSLVYFKGVPPASLISVCIPYLVIFLKIVALLYIGAVKLLNRPGKKRSIKKREREDGTGPSDRSSVKSWWSVGHHF